MQKMEVNLDSTLSTSVSSNHSSSEKHIGRADFSAELKAKDEDPCVSGEASVKGSGSDLGAVDDGNLAWAASYRASGSGHQSSLNGNGYGYGIKAQQLYSLRRNPKPSKRFEDPKLPMEMAPSLPPRKTTKSQECMECGREFASSRALAGHMRCHPEREWRGIHCRKRENKSTQSEAKSQDPLSHMLHFEADNQSDAESIEAAYMNAKFKQSEAKFEDSTSHMLHFEADDQSDAESIEAAYMNGQFKQNFRSWRTGKRSKHQGRSPQASPSEIYELGSQSAIGGVKEDRDMANCLVMLAYAGEIQEHDSHGMGWKRSIRSPELRGQGNNLEFDGVSEEKKEDIRVDPDKINGELHFECKICKRVFKSRQALGGHKASHKKVKNCFARAPDSDRASHSPEEDLTDEDPPNCRQPNFQGQVHRLPISDPPEISRAKHPNKPNLSHAQRVKPHKCSICQKTFPSGQALGGHKRCHSGGIASLETSFGQKHQLKKSEKSKITLDQLPDHHFPAPKDSAYDFHSDLNGASIPNHMHLLKIESKFNHHIKNNHFLRLNSIENGALHTLSSGSAKHKLPGIASSYDKKLQGVQGG